jgi:hypothetical protein
LIKFTHFTKNMEPHQQLFAYITGENWNDAITYLNGDSDLSQEQKKEEIRNVNNNGESCLHNACRRASDKNEKSIELIQLMLDIGGSDLVLLNAPNGGRTAKDCAVDNNFSKEDGPIFKLLREYGDQTPTESKERKPSTTQFRMGGFGFAADTNQKSSVDGGTVQKGYGDNDGDEMGPITAHSNANDQNALGDAADTNHVPRVDRGTVQNGDGNNDGDGDNDGGDNHDDFNKRSLSLTDLYINCEFQRQMHRLAQDYFRKREVLYHFYPVTILTMASGALAFLATADVIEARTKTILSIAVGFCSIISGAFQSCAKFRNYAARSEMHKNVALGMEMLGSNIIFQQIDPEKGVHKGTKENPKKGDDNNLNSKLGPHESTSETVEGFRMVFNQIMESNDSTIPNPIGQAFSLVDARLAIMLSNRETEEHIKVSLSLSKLQAKRIIRGAAYSELYSEISSKSLWPIFPTNPHQAAENSIKKVKDIYLENSFSKPSANNGSAP